MSIVTEPKHKRTDAPQPFRHPFGDGGVNEETSRPKARRPINRKLLIIPAAVVAVLLILVAISTIVSGLNRPNQPLVYHTVERGGMSITVTERGNLESQDNVEVFCELEDIRGDNIDGTSILWIVPNGSSVKEGDLLVELDTAGHQDRLDIQILDTERARAEQIQARAKYENQITQNETNYAEAELQVRLAELELEMFVDENNGTHQLELEEIKRTIDDVNNEILAAQANLELKKNEKSGIESLYKLGYTGRSEVERSRLDFLQAESAYAAKMNRLKTQQATLAKKQTYEREMQLLQLKGNVNTAKRNLEQVKLNNKALLEQAKAAMEAADRAYEKEKERLERDRSQIGKGMIYAPQDGMVAYATSNSRYRRVRIGEGQPMRPRQKILTLPNLAKMQVKTSIHESVLDKIESGLPAVVRIDAFPDRQYVGSVQQVAVLPDPDGWMSSDTKVYETIVTIDEEVEQLKPGMTAVVEIQVDRLEDVLAIPVQAVVQIGKDTWCYVDNGDGIEQRPLVLGRTNDKLVEVEQGLEEGDRVILNPRILAEQTGVDSDEEGEDESSDAASDEETGRDSDEDELTMESGSKVDSEGDSEGEMPAERDPPGAPRGTQDQSTED